MASVIAEPELPVPFIALVIAEPLELLLKAFTRALFPVEIKLEPKQDKN